MQRHARELDLGTRLLSAVCKSKPPRSCIIAKKKKKKKRNSKVMRLSLLRETPPSGALGGIRPLLKQTAPGWGLITGQMSILRGLIKGQTRARLWSNVWPVMISRVKSPPNPDFAPGEGDLT